MLVRAVMLQVRLRLLFPSSLFCPSSHSELRGELGLAAGLHGSRAPFSCVMTSRDWMHKQDFLWKEPPSSG